MSGWNTACSCSNTGHRLKEPFHDWVEQWPITIWAPRTNQSRESLSGKIHSASKYHTDIWQMTSRRLYCSGLMSRGSHRLFCPEQIFMSVSSTLIFTDMSFRPALCSFYYDSHVIYRRLGDWTPSDQTCGSHLWTTDMRNNICSASSN